MMELYKCYFFPIGEAKGLVVTFNIEGAGGPMKMETGLAAESLFMCWECSAQVLRSQIQQHASDHLDRLGRGPMPANRR